MYSWQIDGSDGWAATSRVHDDQVVLVMLDMWKFLPDPVICAALFSVAHTVMQFPHLFSLLQDVSTHSFVASTFVSIALSFNSDISAVAIAVREALPTLQAMLVVDDFRAVAAGSSVVGCILECCVRSWQTFNRLLYLDRDVLLVAFDLSAAAAPKRLPKEKEVKNKDAWGDGLSSIDPLLVWSDHYLRVSDHASGGSVADSSCPSPSAFAPISLPFCHVSTLTSSITFIVALFEDSPALKDTITSNSSLLQLVKSAILNFPALFSWMDLVSRRVSCGDLRRLTLRTLEP